jgi:hypothetical protein
MGRISVRNAGGTNGYRVEMKLKRRIVPRIVGAENCRYSLQQKGERAKRWI